MKCILSILSLLFFLSSTVLGQTEETYEVTYVDSVGYNYSAYAPQPLVETVVEGETYELRSRQGKILATVPVSPYDYRGGTLSHDGYGCMGRTTEH